LKLIKTSIFSAIITFIRLASGFVVSKVVALLTGAEGIAILGQFANFITIVLTFANGAINNGVIKYTAEYDGNEIKLKSLFSTSLKISIICSAAIGLILLVLAPYCSIYIFDTNAYSNVIRTFGLTIAFYSLNSLLISILNGKKQIKNYTIVNTTGSIVGLIFSVVLVYFYKIEGALYALVLSQSIVFFVTFFLIIKSPWFQLSYFIQPFSSKLAKLLGGFSLMAIVSTVTTPFVQIILRNILIYRLGINNAGYWQGMMRISDAYLLIITTSLSTYYLPKLSSLETDEELKKEIFYGYKLLLPLVFFGCLLVYFLRFFIIKTLYTADFIKMEELFIFQLIGDFFKIGMWILGYVILAKALTRLYIILEVVLSITYLILSYIFVNIYQLKGITIAFAINYFLGFIMLLFFFRKLLFRRNG
jgi:O-antigen/teichoic acid export membrane protein